MAVKEKKPNNPLLARIGTNTPKQKNISTKRKASSKNNNPLAAALEKGRLSTQTLSDRIRPVGSKASSSNGMKTTSQKGAAKTTQSKAKTSKVSKTPVSFAKYVQKYKDQGARSQSKKNQTKQPASQNNPTTKVLTIKKNNAPGFLRLKNLQIGTSASELEAVLLPVGQITDIRMKDLPSGSTTAEVQFKSEASLLAALMKLNGTVADGRVLQAEISTTHEILTMH
ncbi:CYFA0S01e13234g1_1 [Cyberlindnera fabianii]|uniref:CYFA0S01e13234g1_1 n=1 Tax=Cyberlindnera fabianii TaxID=36022 RepID=A0A061AJ91_CYBFA|nr:CYFA0S01e13234g1_1 [Cyberlindnera fabianii]